MGQRAHCMLVFDHSGAVANCAAFPTPSDPHLSFVGKRKNPVVCSPALSTIQSARHHQQVAMGVWCSTVVHDAAAQIAHAWPGAPQHAHPEGVAAPFPVLAVADRFTSTRSSCFAADSDSMPGRAAAIFRNNACMVQVISDGEGCRGLQEHCASAAVCSSTRPHSHLDVEASLGARLNKHDIEFTSFGIPLLDGHLPAQGPPKSSRGTSSLHSQMSYP